MQLIFDLKDGFRYLGKQGPALERVKKMTEVLQHSHRLSDEIKGRVTLDLVHDALTAYGKVMHHNASAWKYPAEYLPMIGLNIGCPDKSSLLVRLLSGEKPLRYPAPTAYSYPAYHLVTANLGQEYRCSVYFPSKEESIIDAMGLDDLRLDAIIDQCGWSVELANEPAEQIAQMMRAGEESFDGQQFMELVSQSPRWSVRQGHWPAWDLLIGETHGSTGSYEYLLELKGALPDYPRVLSGSWGVQRFDEAGLSKVLENGGKGWLGYVGQGFVLRKGDAWADFERDGGLFLEI